MITLNPSSAVILDPDSIMMLDGLPDIITLSSYDPAGSFSSIYWDVSAVSKNIKMTTSVSWDSDTTPNNTFFMIFGVANNNDPRTASNSVFVEIGCIDGFVGFKLSKRSAGVLSSTTEVSSREWNGGQLFIGIGLNAALQKLVVTTNIFHDIIERQTFELTIPAYAFTRIYMFGSSASVSPVVANLTLATEIVINSGFIYNKNKTTIGNMVDYVKYRTGLEFNAADITFSNVTATYPDGPGTILNTLVDISGSGTNVLSGNTTLSYSRILLQSVINEGELMIAEPFTEQSIITAYNAQYGMNLTVDDVILTPSSGATFNNWDGLLMEATSSNLCLIGSSSFSIYHPV